MAPELALMDRIRARSDPSVQQAGEEAASPVTGARVILRNVGSELHSGLATELLGRYELMSPADEVEARALISADPPPAAVIVAVGAGSHGEAPRLMEATRDACPDAARILLADLSEGGPVAEVVNDAGVHRLLDLAVPARDLREALEAAMSERRLAAAERRLLEEALTGAIRAIAGLAGLARPEAAARAARVRAYAEGLVEPLGFDGWTFALAAELSQIGAVTLPEGAVQMAGPESPIVALRMAVAQLPTLGADVIVGIPSLEPVERTLREAGAISAGGPTKGTMLEAQAIAVLLEIDAIEQDGFAGQDALDRLRGDSRRFSPRVLDAIGSLPLVESGKALPDDKRAEIEVAPERLVAGMILSREVRVGNDLLLAKKGNEVSEGLIAYLRNLVNSGVSPPMIWVRRGS